MNQGIMYTSPQMNSSKIIFFQKKFGINKLYTIFALVFKSKNEKVSKLFKARLR